MEQVLLSTRDNPYNPWTDWDSWLNWDEDHGYYTNALIARLASPSFMADDAEIDELTDMATLSIMMNDVTNMYVLVPSPSNMQENEG